MSEDLHNFYFIYRSYPGHDERVDYKIRLSIFLIYAECAGWAALVWALVVLHRHRKHNGRIPALVIIVLLNTMLELLLNPYVITKLIQDDWHMSFTVCLLYSLWFGSVTCGVHLQQMMVLESFLALRHPSCSAHVFFPPCSIILYIIVFLCFFLCAFFLPLVFLILTVIPLISVNVVSWIVVCRTPPNDDSSNRTKKPDYTLLAYGTTTLIIYLFFVILGCFGALWEYIYISDLFMMFLCLLSLRVVVDPLLCVLVCKQKNTESPVQTAVETEQSVEAQC